MPTNPIAFVGRKFHLRSHLEVLSSVTGSQIKNFVLADQACSAVDRERFSLIIVRDELDKGSMQMPAGIVAGARGREDFGSQVSAEFIRYARFHGLNNFVPILVPYTKNDRITSINLYLEAGATTCLDVLHEYGTTTDFVRKVKQYLKANPNA